MPLLSDAMLGAAVRSGLKPVVRAAARKAAARALHQVALAGGGDDAAVLATLGLWQAARDAGGAGDAGARAGRQVALAALGEGGAAGALPPEWRLRLAGALAPRDPLAAAALLPTGSLAAAACRYADDPARAEVPAEAHGAEAELLRAGIAHASGADAVAPFNGVFEGLGLCAPASRSTRLAELGGAGTAIEGGPLVSVVVPLHQGALTVETALGSLTRQTWRAIEVLVVDDRSTDGGPEIVVAWAQRDSRIRLLQNNQEPGAYGARNTGLAEAAGEYIAFLDADDWAHPQRIARQVASVRDGIATASRHFRIDEAGRPVAPRVFPLIRFCPISLLVRREAIARAGPFLPAETGADAELLARLDWLFGRRAVPRDAAPLTVASWRPGSLSSDRDTGMLAAERSEAREHWMREHARRWTAGEGLP